MSGPNGAGASLGSSAAGMGSSRSGGESFRHVPSYKRPSCALGVLMTGYLDKWDPNALVKKVKRRFVVLTHESVHWFKRAAGYDLFGEERGSISLGDIASIEIHRPRRGSRGDNNGNADAAGDAAVAQGGGNAFIICTTDFTKRVFVAASKEEAAKWLGAIQTAMKNRYLYRRETLSGLSFLQSGDEGLDANRPRILLLSLLRQQQPGGAEGAGAAGSGSYGSNGSSNGSSIGGKAMAEWVLARNVEYEKGHALPPLLPGDRLLLTLLHGGATATLSGADVIAHAQAPSKEERLKAQVVGGQGGSLLLTTTLVAPPPDQAPTPRSFRGGAGARGSSSSGAVSLAAHVLSALFLQPEHAVPLLAAAGLLGAALASLTDRRRQLCLGTFREACRELRFGAMVFVALALAAHALLSLLLRLRAEWAEERTAQEQEAAQGGPVVPGIYLEVEDYLVAAPATAGRGGGEGAGGDDILSQIPQRYIDGCLGDMTEAARRWRVTVEWRRAYGTDTILEQAHPYFKLIKECYPHYFCMTGRDGNPVYYERSGQVDQARLRAAGCGTDELVWHYVYATEFCYQKLHPRETAKTVTVFDVEGVGIRDLAGDAFEFLRKSSSLIQEHYVERSEVIMIVNAPSWFSFLWKMIKPMVNERTQKKVRIVPGGRETHECIKEFVDPANMPKRYGGELSYENESDCRWHSPEEIALREHVEAVNARLGVEFKMA